jgi:Ca2+-binding RTX toxin-like protein
MLKKSKISKYLFAGAFFAALITVTFLSINSFAAGNVVPASKIGYSNQTVDANDVKPAECASINLTNIIYCSGSNNCNGTNANDLILGTSEGEKISGVNGTDCIVGGGGDDTIRGGNGTDVCIGGPGTDTFSKCAITYP